MLILGINGPYHELAACLIQDGRIISMVEEERLTRRKHGKISSIDNPHRLPDRAIAFCLERCGARLADVDVIGYPLVPELRLKNSELAPDFEEGSWGSESGEKLFHDLVRTVPEQLQDRGFRGRFEWLEHHRCHAASAFFPSPFDRAGILTIDGIGETATTSVFRGQGRILQRVGDLGYPHSLGFVWERFSTFLGFTRYDAGKVMGLAGHGDPRTYLPVLSQLVRTTDDGWFWVDNDVMRFRVSDHSALENALGLRVRQPQEEITVDHMDLAASLQTVTNEVVSHLVASTYEWTGEEALCLAGGVALNCIANAAAHSVSRFGSLYVTPAAHDAGTALGAALLLSADIGLDGDVTLPHAYLGPRYDEDRIESALRRAGLRYERPANLTQQVAEDLIDGLLVGWFHDACEVGPRALGNRSLLADPRRADVVDLINTRIKHREWFRPFAPSVLAEEAGDWFRIRKPTTASDFMLMAYPALPHTKEQAPAIVHVDGTSRIQTVRASTNPLYHDLITRFYQLTGVPMVLNTSFNDSEPIVCSPEDAISTFVKGELDRLVIGPFIAR